MNNDTFSVQIGMRISIMCIKASQQEVNVSLIICFNLQHTLVNKCHRGCVIYDCEHVTRTELHRISIKSINVICFDG